MTMTLPAPKIELQPPHRTLARAGTVLREALCISCGQCALDCVREPDGLQYPPLPRARRLMRNARVSAW